MAVEDTSYYENVLENTLGIPFVGGNRIEILKNGDRIFPAMMTAIESATVQIDFMTYVYWQGDIAERFADALVRKAREGLRVRVILDAFGAKPMPLRLVDKMVSGGVALRWFRPLARWKLWNIDNRTHRKILVCDGKTGFTGGVGIAREWEGDARNPDEWRDTHFRLQGPVVRSLYAAFLENWLETEGVLQSADLSLPKPPEGLPQNGASAQVVRTSASVRWSDIAMLFRTLLLTARRSVKIATAYFDPDMPMVDILREAAGRGVAIDILMPGKYTDSRISKIAGESNYDPLLAAGIGLWHYQKSMMHAKIILVDDMLACIGTANFNQRSMGKDEELSLLTTDASVVKTLAEHFQEDLQSSLKLSASTWVRRGLIQRLLEAVVLPFKSQI